MLWAGCLAPASLQHRECVFREKEGWFSHQATSSQLAASWGTLRDWRVFSVPLRPKMQQRIPRWWHSCFISCPCSFSHTPERTRNSSTEPKFIPFVAVDSTFYASWVFCTAGARFQHFKKALKCSPCLLHTTKSHFHKDFLFLHNRLE